MLHSVALTSYILVTSHKTNLLTVGWVGGEIGPSVTTSKPVAVPTNTQPYKLTKMHWSMNHA